MACDWVTMAAIRITNPHEALGDFAAMLERMSPMQCIHRVRASYTSLVLGEGGTRVGEGALLDCNLFPV